VSLRCRPWSRGLALLAGKDDIRKFQRMRSM
jgi:hypothetical protein